MNSGSDRSERGNAPVSLRMMAHYVNNASLDGDVMVFEHTAPEGEDGFPSRVDALIIAICTGGSARITIDLNDYDVSEGSLVVIQPRNFLGMAAHSPDFRYSAIACSHNVVEDLMPKLTDILPLLMHHRAAPVTQLGERDVRNLTGFYTLLRDKMNEAPSMFRRHKVRCIIQAALYEMMDINLRNAPRTTLARTRRQEIMARFIIAVGEDFRSERSVAYYARKLCITPKHLSAVVKEISGRTAGDWIETYVVMEAKVLLKSTDMNIQEISDALNFANQSFFGKYFRAHTHMSPTAFRKSQG